MRLHCPFANEGERVCCDALQELKKGLRRAMLPDRNQVLVITSRFVVRCTLAEAVG
jgi:hypothetical protein